MWENQLRIDSMLEFTKTNETVGFFHKYDKCIIENQESLKVFKKIGLKKNNCFLLGSIRFTKEWINIRDKIIPPKNSNKSH